VAALIIQPLVLETHLQLAHLKVMAAALERKFLQIMDLAVAVALALLVRQDQEQQEETVVLELLQAFQVLQ
jgi:hypothetical protein